MKTIVNCSEDNRQLLSRQSSTALKTIIQCSEDNLAVFIIEKTIVHWSEDNLAVPYFLWRQSSSAPFFSIFLNFLWRQLYYCYLFCENNCTSAHEDNCPLVWRQLSTALKTIVNCSFIEKTILLVKTIVPLSPVRAYLLCHLQCETPCTMIFFTVKG